MDAILADYADEIYSEGNHKKPLAKRFGMENVLIFMNERSTINS